MQTSMPKGEYQIIHRRPRPECLEQYIPIWERHVIALEAGDTALADQIRVQELEPLQDIVSEETFPNLVTDVGCKLMLDSIFNNTAAGAVVMGLKGTGTAVVGDTQASHAGWLEVGGANAPVYTGVRPTPSFSAASGAGAGARTKATSASVSFSITSSGTVAGGFLNVAGSSTKDNTTGTMFSAGDFTGGSKTVANLDTLSVSYSLTA